MSEHSPSKVTRNVLTDRETFLLAKFVEKEWPEHSELGDAGFVPFAVSVLGFPISIGNIRGVRKILDIEIQKPALSRSATAEIADLQRRVERLEQRVEVYFKGCRKDAPASVS